MTPKLTQCFDGVVAKLTFPLPGGDDALQTGFGVSNSSRYRRFLLLVRHLTSAICQTKLLLRGVNVLVHAQGLAVIKAPSTTESIHYKHFME